MTMIHHTAVVWGVMLCMALTLGAASAPPAENENLPNIVLTVPANPDHRAYLGLGAEARFTIPQIKADLVIIEIFSMYCPHCQREAPRVNQLYEAIQADATLKERVRLIGIGVGNSPFEVQVFKQKYNIPFPLFSDADFAIHQMLGEVRTPYFIGVRINGDGSHSVTYSRLGGFEDPAAFLDTMVLEAGLHRP